MKQIITDIITIGDEILLGQTVDTNSAWMGKALAHLGFTVRQIISISDNKEAILQTLDKSLKTADIVLITGGLGPTNDDITKHCLTEYFGGTLQMHPEAYANMERFVLERGGSVNENNRQQGLFPDNAKFVPNPCGTASGMWFEQAEKVTVSMPGVPHEMMAMMTQTVLPQIAQKFDAPDIYFRILFVGGISEAKLAEQLTNFEAQLPQEIGMAYLPSPGLIKLRLLATGYDSAHIKQLVDDNIDTLKQELASNLLGEAKDGSDDFIGILLTKKGLTISTAESCTGGGIAARLTSESGSSAYFKGSVVAYANTVKQNILGVPAGMLEQNGAVSQPVVEHMANSVRQLMDTDFGIATSGIAGPTGGTTDKPVGTIWIAIAGPKGVVSQKYKFTDNREQNIQRTILTALRMLVQAIGEL